MVACGMFVALASPDTVRAQSSDGVDIEVSATVVNRCGFLPSSNAATDVVTDLEVATVQTIALKLDCNVPFAIGATATFGKLVNETPSEDVSGYAFDKVYGVRLDIDTDLGNVRGGRCLSTELLAGGSCPFASDVGGQGLGSGGGIAIGRDATLTIDWPDQAGMPRRLAAGRYNDTITLVVGARG